MSNKLRNRLRHEQFLTSPLSLITSHIYFIRRGLYKAILSLAPRIEGHVLDFGCGSKPYESLFHNATSYVGVDIEKSGHDHKNSKVDFYYDGKHLPFEEKRFDAVVAFEVFEHVFNIDEVLQEIGRVLKPGGKMLISVPFAWDEHEMPYDFARYTSYGIKQVLKRNGLNVLVLIKTTTYTLAVGQMLLAYLGQYVAPRYWPFAKIFQIFLIFPLSIIILLVDAVLPKRYEYFCNSVVLAEKEVSA